jgi:hypothetical protein
MKPSSLLCQLQPSLLPVKILPDSLNVPVGIIYDNDVFEILPES